MARPGRKRKSLAIRKPCGRIKMDAPPPDRQWQVYFVKLAGRNRVKIGFTNRMAGRLASLQTGTPERLIWLGAVVCRDRDEAAAAEGRIHEALKERGRHLRGEWFVMTDDEAKTMLDALGPDDPWRSRMGRLTSNLAVSTNLGY